MTLNDYTEWVEFGQICQRGAEIRFLKLQT